jgi:hypothetical protein
MSIRWYFTAIFVSIEKKLLFITEIKMENTLQIKPIRLVKIANKRFSIDIKSNSILSYQLPNL